MVAWKTNSFTIMAAIKVISVEATGRGRDSFIDLPKPRFLEDCHYFTCLAVSWKRHSRGLSLLDLTQSLLTAKALSLGHLSKTICDNCLKQQLLEVMITVGVNEKLTKKLKVKAREQDAHEGFGKVEILLGLWEGTLAGLSERPGICANALITHFWLTLRLWVRRKGRL